ncbi:MAG: hypothetical protein LBM74_02765 [Oscillospiraceae bacterium]|nr:hypothetical protein [Oscillospiraceae bacterium]
MFRAVQLYDQYLIGREEGYKIGLEKGLKKAERIAMYEIVQTLTQQNYTDSQIAAIFSMTESDLAALRTNPPKQEEANV